MAGAGRASTAEQSMTVVSPATTVMGSSLGLRDIWGRAATDQKDTRVLFLIEKNDTHISPQGW